MNNAKAVAYASLCGQAGAGAVVDVLTGNVDGTEIVQLYISRKKGHEGVFRPVRELNGFARVALKKGESQSITIPFDAYTFRYYDVKNNKWQIEGGDWNICIGASVEDIRLQGKWHTEGIIEDPYEGKGISDYITGKVENVPDNEFSALLGHPIPDRKVKIDRNITFNQLNHGRSPLFWLIWFVMTMMKKASDRSGKPNLNLLFIYNMPLRGLAKMTGGFVSMGMVDALVMEIQGFWVIGIVRFLIELILNLVRSASLSAKIAE